MRQARPRASPSVPQGVVETFAVLAEPARDHREAPVWAGNKASDLLPAGFVPWVFALGGMKIAASRYRATMLG